MISLQEGCLCSMCDKQSRINIIQAMSIRTETLVHYSLTITITTPDEGSCLCPGCK